MAKEGAFLCPSRIVMEHMLVWSVTELAVVLFDSSWQVID